MHPVWWVRKNWGGEVWVGQFDLSQGWTRGTKGVRKCCIGVPGSAGQDVRFTGSEFVPSNIEGSAGWRVVSQIRGEASGDRVIKEANASANDRVVGDAKRLPRKTEPRRPDDSIGIGESLFLMSQD